MALFGRKEDKSPIDKLIALYNEMKPEDKKAFHDKIMDVEKAEDEREIDKVEEEKADTMDKADEKAEEVKDESKEIGKDVDKAEEIADDDTKDGEDDGNEKEAEEEMDEAKDAKWDALMQEFDDYKRKVDEIYDKMTATEKPAEKVGLERQKAVDNAEEDDEMSASEYAKKYAKY